VLTRRSSDTSDKLTFDLGAATYDALTSITFRLYIWDNATLQNDLTRIDSLTVEGVAR
jgi:hypothetical protein